jgi:hypothetical protein
LHSPQRGRNVQGQRRYRQWTGEGLRPAAQSKCFAIM